MKLLRTLAAVAAFLLMGGHANASGPTAHDIFNEALSGEFGEIIRTQALLEHVCKQPLLANQLSGPGHKALAPLMPPIKGADPGVWEQIAGALYIHLLQYQAGYAAGVDRAVTASPQSGELTLTAQLCESALRDAKRWTAKPE